MIELNYAFFVQLINFGILVLVLNTFLYKPIRKILSERRQVIESARSKADAVDQEVQEKMALYEQRLRETKAEAAALRSEALKQAQNRETSILEKARAEAADTLAAMRERVAGESAEARLLLKQQVDGLSGEICTKILGRSL